MLPPVPPYSCVPPPPPPQFRPCPLSQVYAGQYNEQLAEEFVQAEGADICTAFLTMAPHRLGDVPPAEKARTLAQARACLTVLANFSASAPPIPLIPLLRFLARIAHRRRTRRVQNRALYSFLKETV